MGGKNGLRLQLESGHPKTGRGDGKPKNLKENQQKKEIGGKAKRTWGKKAPPGKKKEILPKGCEGCS